MALRELIPWNRKRDVRVRRRGETEVRRRGETEMMVYIVKWIPKGQDVIIDHSTRYSDPSRAIEFAVNALQLSPKRIWIEDGKGLEHSDYETILGHFRGFATDQSPVTVPASNEQDEARRVGSEAEVPVEQPSPSSPSQPVDSGPATNEENHVILSEVKVPLDEPNTDRLSTNQVDPVPTQKQQDQQEQVDTVLSEIRSILAEPPPIHKARSEQGNAAVVVSEIDNFDARPEIESKSAIPFNTPHIQHKQDEPNTSDAVIQEIEALLGISSQDS